MMNQSNRSLTQPLSPSLIITLGLLCAVVFLFNYLTPEYLDDYIYKFCYIHGSHSVSNPVQSIWDVFTSQTDHYFNSSGRFSVYFLVQTFTGLLGKSIFNFFNTLVFLLFIIGLSRYAFKSINVTSVLLSLVIFLLCMPHFAESSLWMTGSISYLWPSTALVYFLLYLKRHRHRRFHIRHLPLALFILLLGLSHEDLVVPLAAGLVFYALQHKYHRFNDLYSNLVFYFCIGSFLCIFSPGSVSNRLSMLQVTDNGLVAGMIYFLSALGSLRAFWLAIVALCLVGIKHRMPKFFKKNSDLMVAVLVAALMAIFNENTGENGLNLYAVEFYAMLLVLRAIGLTDYRHPLVNLAATVVLVALGGAIVYYSHLNHQYVQQLQSQFKTASNGLVQVENTPVPGFMRSYVCPAIPDVHNARYSNGNINSLLNRSIAATYGIDSLAFIPKAFFNQLKHQPDAYRKFNLKDHALPYYCRVLGPDESVSDVHFRFQPTDYDQLPWYVRPVAPYLKRFTVKDVKSPDFDVVYVGQTRYIFIPRLQTIDFRIKSIELE